MVAAPACPGRSLAHAAASAARLAGSLSPPPVTAPLGRVTDLFVYPIKSLAGVRLEQADVGDLGLTLDRRWMLVDADGVFRTQRELPHLALARATPDGDGITVTAPGEDPLSIAPSAPAAPRRSVRVWHDVVEAATYPAAVDAWFTRVVGAPEHGPSARKGRRRAWGRPLRRHDLTPRPLARRPLDPGREPRADAR